MTIRHPTSLTAGLIVAAAGILPLALIAWDSQPEQVVETSTTIGLPETTVIEISPPEVAGLDPRIGRVLYAYGAASGVEPGSPGDLPEQIVKVLSYYDVILTVETGDGP